MVEMRSLNLHRPEKSYLLSGFLSISFYLTCIFLLLLYLNKSETKKIDAMSKNTVLQLEIIVDKTEKKIRKSTSKNKKVEIKKEEKIVKKSKSVSITKTADVKSLFSKVTTKAKKIEKKTVSNVKKSVVSSRFRSNFEKQKKQNNVKVSNILDDVTVKSKPNIAMDSKHTKDPYFSKIYELLIQRWNALTFGEFSSKVTITITSAGRFDYSSFVSSGNDLFDATLKEFLENQKLELYPPYTKGSKTEITVVFGTEK